MGAKNCKFETKKHGSAVNPLEAIEKKVEELTASKNKCLEGGARGGTKMMVDADIMLTNDELPSWSDALQGEDSLYGHSVFERAFNQIGILDHGVKVDEAKKEITLDFSKQPHVHNGKDKSGHSRKLWQILLGNQSTCGAIFNEALVQNIRDCKWTLSLQRQKGGFRTNQTVDMPGVDEVWVYREGIDNILSQNRMVKLSKLKISFSISKYHQSGDIND